MFRTRIWIQLVSESPDPGMQAARMGGMGTNVSRTDLEKMIEIRLIMGGHRSGDPTTCSCIVRTGGGPNSRRAHHHGCKHPVSVVDLDGNGWCTQHATADHTVICDQCHMTSEQGCVCEALSEHGLTEAFKLADSIEYPTLVTRVNVQSEIERSKERQ
jgi:hypothetical protein